METFAFAILSKEIESVEHILLVKRDNAWEFPRAQADSNGNVKEALRKEVEDKLGLLILGEFAFNFPNSGKNSQSSIFQGKVLDEFSSKAPDPSTKWFSILEALDQDFASDQREILMSYLERKEYGGDKNVLLKEFSELRSEILKHMDNRVKIIQFAILLFGAFLGFAKVGKDQIDHNVIMFYPILATFLAALWAHSDVRIYELASYIKLKLEPRLDLGWEKFIYNLRLGKGKRLLEKAALGIFLISELTAVIFVPMQNDFNWYIIEWQNPEYILLMTLDIFALIFTIHFLGLRGRKYKKALLSQ